MLGPPLARSLSAALRDAESDKPHVRVSALRDLALHLPEDRSGQAALALRDALLSDASAEVRARAAVAFADAESRTAIEALLRATGDPDVHVRQMVLLALGELGRGDHPRVLEVVEEALAGDAPALRFQALIACHKLGMERADGALLAATRDPDGEIRHVALRLLEERATTSGGDTEPSDEVREAVAACLSDPLLSVRLAAAILLARAGDLRGEAVLAEAARPGPRIDPEDEQAAIVLAGELRLDAARGGLERRAFRGLFGRDRFDYEARIALARMGDARARRAIARGLSAWSRDARTLAVVAAGHAELTEALGAILAMKDDPRRAEPEAVDLALRLLRAAGA